MSRVGASLLERRQKLIQALQTSDEFFGEGFAGLSPEQTTGDTAVFFYGQCKGKEHFYVLLNALLGEFIQSFIFQGVVHDPWGVEAEVDADVAVLLEAGVVELGAKAEDADDGGAEFPEG